MNELQQIWDSLVLLVSRWISLIYIDGWAESVQMFKVFTVVWISIYILGSWAFNDNIVWYHRLLIRIPVIQFMCVTKFKDGHRVGVILGMKQGHQLTGSSKKLKHGKIIKTMKKAGMA